MKATGDDMPTSSAVWVTDELVRIGPLTVRIVSDVPAFPALRYFSRLVRTPLSPPGETTTKHSDFELWCVSRVDLQFDNETGCPVDQTSRAKGFRSGYYVTDHFGPPVVSITRGRRVYLFGRELQGLIWPYYVKYLLQRHAVATGGLFLKAAAIEVDGAATLILGRGGAGKTVMLTELCRRGAGFISNSNTVVAQGAVAGVASSLRFRPGPWLDRLRVPTAPAIDPSEVVVDPLDAFPVWAMDPVPVRHIVVADYRGSTEHLVKKLSQTEALNIMTQFGLGLNVYRLEEDLLDDLAGDYRAFAQAHKEMHERLRELVGNCDAHAVSTDVLRGTNQGQLFAMLG